MIKPTIEMTSVAWDALPVTVRQSGEVDLDDMKAVLAVVFPLAEAALLRGVPLDGEPVWGVGRKRQVSMEMQNNVTVEDAYLGEADRPSEVARLLRQAATDIETAFTSDPRAEILDASLPKGAR